MGKFYDLTFVGAGPSTVFALLELVDKGYEGSICVIEKGKSLRERKPSDVLCGFCGAGTFSDSKLSSALEVGGTIPGMTQDELDDFSSRIIKTFNKFKKLTQSPSPIKWDTTTSFDTKGSGLTWDIHKTCHVGTDNGRAIYAQIEEFLRQQPNIKFKFKKEVTSVFDVTNGFEVVMGEDFVMTHNLIIATGQKNLLPETIKKEFKLDTTPRAFQLGVRVEDQMNDQYREIIKANYDFKFVKTYLLDEGVKVRVRTFCCNSGNAHVCAEKTDTGFTCFNGHAFKEPDPTNHTVNYGIICEAILDKYNTKNKQIKLMQKVNKIKTWEQDNFQNGGVVASRKLLDGFEFLAGCYPNEILIALNDFVKCLNKLVDLSQATFYYPEVKLSGDVPNLDYSTFETKYPNLYIIGDAGVSRGILKASYTGYKFATEYLNKLEKQRKEREEKDDN